MSFGTEWCGMCINSVDCYGAVVRGDDGRLKHSDDATYCLNYRYDDTCWYLATFGRMCCHEPWHFSDNSRSIVPVYRSKAAADAYLAKIKDATTSHREILNEVWVQRTTEGELGGRYKIRYADD